MTAAQQQQMGGGPPGQPAGMFPEEMIGAIKIKDGLFIGDELASTVSYIFSFCSIGRVYLQTEDRPPFS